MKIKTEKQYYKLLFIIAVLFAVIVNLIVFFNTTPYILSVKEKNVSDSYRHCTFYRDINSDGITNKFTLTKVIGQKGESILFYNNDDLLVAQFNSNYEIQPHLISFHDYNSNGTEELFLFSVESNSIFLTIIDLINCVKILNEQLIISDINANNNIWDIDILTILDNVNNDNVKDLIFSVSAGFSLYPRGVFTFDIYHKKIINSFLASAKIRSLELFDIDNDGDNEIIASTSATGNGDPNEKYNDHTSWLFVFNKYLSFNLKPRNYGKHPSALYSQSIRSTDGNYIVSAFNYSNNTSEPPKIEIIDFHGNVIKEKVFPEIIDYHLLKINSNGENLFLLSFKNGSNIVMDENLNIIEGIEAKLGYGVFIKEVNVINNGNNEIIFCTPAKMFLLDTQFNILASIPIDFRINGKPNYLTIKKTGLKSEKLIAINTVKGKYLYQIEKNEYFSILPYISFLSLFVFFLALIIIHRASKRVSRRFKSLDYLIKESEKGILIIDQSGKVKSFNNYMTMIGVNFSPIKINQHFTKFLMDDGELYKFIKNGILSNQKETKELLIRLDNKVNRFKTTILPMISFWGFPYAYLIEFDNITEPIISERQRLWSKTSQNIAHNIKTPLSTIQLNLAALNKRLESEDISERESFNDDISMIRSEVNRIRSLTQGFLKFANLERPNLQIVNFKGVVEKSLQQFHSYTENGIKIATQYRNIDDTTFVDPNQIEQLVNIIIENAIDALEGKGIIEIKTELVQKISSEIFLQVEISDNGSGIDKSKINEIFEPYFTSKKDGTGLGLAIAKKIVEDNNGEIRIYSKVGLGTTVTILLPFANDIEHED